MFFRRNQPNRVDVWKLERPDAMREVIATAANVVDKDELLFPGADNLRISAATYLGRMLEHVDGLVYPPAKGERAATLGDVSRSVAALMMGGVEIETFDSQKDSVRRLEEVIDLPEVPAEVGDAFQAMPAVDDLLESVYLDANRR